MNTYPQTKRQLLASMIPDGDPGTAKVWTRNGIRFQARNGDRCYQYHDTLIVRQSADGIRIYTGGFRTVTTKERINVALRELESGLRVIQDRGLWYLGNQKDWHQFPFTEGVLIAPGDKVETNGTEHREQLRLRKLITVFMAYARKKLTTEPMPLPNAGDCWYCHMSEVNSGKSLAEVTKNPGCLISHCEEKYLHGSLIYRAVKARRPVLGVALARKDDGRAMFPDMISDDLRHYLKHHLLGT